MKEISNVRAIDRALDILCCLDDKKTELSLTDISKEVDLARSTTTRILSTLEKREFLFRDKETQKYSLGPRIAQLGMICFSNMDFRKIAKPMMAELRDMYNESVSLYIVQGNHRVCIERIESTHPLRRVINIGDRLVLTRGASGRLLLAYTKTEKLREILEKDPYTTEGKLEELRKKEYAVSRGEREEGVTSIAAPIFNARKKMITALAISGPSIRFPEEELTERIEVVKNFARKISLSLGYKED